MKLTHYQILTLPSTVVLDGREVFWVGPAGRHNAAERASVISTRLRREAGNPEASSLDGASQDEMVLLKLGGRPLLDVTAADPAPGHSVEDQARAWLLDIEQALAQAKTERSAAYLGHAAGLSLLAVVLAAAVFAGAVLAGASLAGAFLAGAFLAGAVVASAFLAGAFAAALLASARRALVDVADRESLAGRLSTTTVM